MLAGWEISNTPDIPAEAWARSDAIGATIVKVRPYHLLGPSGAQNAAEINRRGLAVALRPDSDRGDMTVFVSQVVQCAAMLSVSRLYVILDSEPNLGSRPVEPWYWPIIGQMLDDLRLRLPSARVVSPPMAVAQRDDEWLAAGADVIRGCDYVGVHCYGQDDTSLIARSLQLAAQFGRPLLAAEVGDSHPSIGDRQRAASVASYLRVLTERGDVEAACIFIAYSRDPQWQMFQLPVDTLGIVRDALSAEEEPVDPITIESAPDMVAGAVWPFRARARAGGLATLLGHLPLKPDKSTYWQDFVLFKQVGPDGVLTFDFPVPQVPDLSADGIEVDWQIDVMFPPDATQTHVRVKLLPTLSAAEPFTPTPEHTPASEVFYNAGTAYDRTLDERFIRIQELVNAINGGPDEPQYENPGSLDTIFYSAGEGYNHDQDDRWLDIQRLVDAIKTGSPLPQGTFVIPAEVYDATMQVCSQFGTDPAVCAAMEEHESGFNPKAVGDNGHSIGLLQLHDQGMGAGLTVAQREDPVTNLTVGMRAQAAYLAEFGSIEAAVTAHNAGGPAVRTYGWQNVVHHREGNRIVYVKDIYTFPILKRAQEIRSMGIVRGA